MKLPLETPSHDQVNLARLHTLKARAGLSNSEVIMTDEELFATFLNLVKRAGGVEALAEALKNEGEEHLAESVRQYATCTTAAEFMALEH